MAPAEELLSPEELNKAEASAKGEGGLLPVVRDLFGMHNGAKKAWQWAMAPKGAASKAKRFGALAHYAANQRDQTRGDDRAVWAERRKEYAKRREEYERRHEAQQHDVEKWPESLAIVEYLYHNPGPHFHLAVYPQSRNGLIAIGAIAEARGIRVGEFPPYDVVECVHTGYSWHYRDSGDGGAPRTCANRGNGLAADMNDYDGGNDAEYALYIEVGRRYL